jgi:hypothetical protein
MTYQYNMNLTNRLHLFYGLLFARPAIYHLLFLTFFLIHSMF